MKGYIRTVKKSKDINADDLVDVRQYCPESLPPAQCLLSGGKQVFTFHIEAALDNDEMVGCYTPAITKVLGVKQ